MKHAPSIELANARRVAYAAAQECPHWDYENPGGDEHACCKAMRDADQDVRVLRRQLTE